MIVMKWMFLFILFATVSVMAEDVEFLENIKELKRHNNALETYLFQLNPDCMDFLEWHEFNP